MCMYPLKIKCTIAKDFIFYYQISASKKNKLLKYHSIFKIPYLYIKHLKNRISYYLICKKA